MKCYSDEGKSSSLVNDKPLINIRNTDHTFYHSNITYWMESIWWSLSMFIDVVNDRLEGF